jgi:hypothetical protein
MHLASADTRGRPLTAAGLVGTDTRARPLTADRPTCPDARTRPLTAVRLAFADATVRSVADIVARTALPRDVVSAALDHLLRTGELEQQALASGCPSDACATCAISRGCRAAPASRTRTLVLRPFGSFAHTTAGSSAHTTGGPFAHMSGVGDGDDAT